jgi:hypothetical protein
MYNDVLIFTFGMMTGGMIVLVVAMATALLRMGGKRR